VVFATVLAAHDADDLFVANGGHLPSAKARLGRLLVGANGAAVVGEDGSLWQTGNSAVGKADSVPRCSAGKL
jgi:hypothetical protein